MKINEIKSIIKDFEQSSLTVLELETDTVKLKLSKNKEQLLDVKESLETSVSIESPQQEFKKEEKVSVKSDKVIKSPLVGTFYESSTPNGKPFVKIGDSVKKGQVVCIVEAMKIMNEITAPYDGVIDSVCFKNGDVVGFDDVLFVLV
ncbi:acetyl-CoA carboxylase biotin carboxyl carrier protein [Acholeplasma equifetale]|uniref:acetyl-CoA carboxylase biotin carboxyl carrier protein n=1 Tax=Acholeplasma equifetale TaxID=264634 RepID=UPI00047B34A6|nr:acetyl-CoA carboxylase biotin carboxyl carrier protein [Acholeplasma equifetale]